MLPISRVQFEFQNAKVFAAYGPLLGDVSIASKLFASSDIYVNFCLR
jgi:hypothetical protein